MHIFKHTWNVKKIDYVLDHEESLNKFKGKWYYILHMKNWGYVLYYVEYTPLFVLLCQVRGIWYSQWNCQRQWYPILIHVTWDLWQTRQLLKFGSHGLSTWHWEFTVNVCMYLCSCTCDLLSKLTLFFTPTP